MNCLVLDAMGVIFESADDVRELLIPFIKKSGGNDDEEFIQAVYQEASLGAISADDFWRRVGLSPELEDAFLSGHSLNAGVLELIHRAEELKLSVWCLSNDVGRWSRKLRSRLDLNRHLAGATISGDVGAHKPDPVIFTTLLSESGYRADELLFVDDRENNVTAARAVGIESILFDPSRGFQPVTAWLTRRVTGQV